MEAQAIKPLVHLLESLLLIDATDNAFRTLLLRWHTEGVSQATMQAALQSMRQEAQQQQDIPREDRILEVMDLITGFTADPLPLS